MHLGGLTHTELQVLLFKMNIFWDMYPKTNGLSWGHLSSTREEPQHLHDCTAKGTKQPRSEQTNLGRLEAPEQTEERIIRT